MESHSIRNVSDFQVEKKQLLEDLFRVHLAENQQVFLVTLTPDVEPDVETRSQAAEEMEILFTQVDQHAQREGISTDAADTAIDEAMEKIRHRKS